MVSPTASLLLRVVVGRIVYSTSNAAVLLGLGVFALSAIHLAIRSVYAVSCSGPYARTPWLVVGFLMAGHALHLVALCIWAANPDTVTLSPQFVWSGGDQSYTSLGHSHLGKPGFAALADLVGFEASGRGYDAGGPLARFVPELLSASIAIACAVSILLIAVAAPALHAGANHETRRVVAFVVGGVSCAQLVADGGPFAFRLGPSALLLAWSLRSPDRAARSIPGPVILRGHGARGFRLRRIGGGIWLAFHLVLACVAADRSIISGLLVVAPQLGLYSLIVGSALWIPRDRSAPRDLPTGPAANLPDASRRFARLALGSCAGLVLAVGIAHDVETDVVPLLAPLSSDARVTCIALSDLSRDPTCRSAEGRSPLSLYSDRGHAFKPADVLIRRESTEAAESTKAYLVAVETDVDTRISLAESELFRVEALYETNLPQAAWILEIDVEDPTLPSVASDPTDVIAYENRQVWMRILDAYLRRSGIDRYVLVPLERDGSVAQRERL